MSRLAERDVYDTPGIATNSPIAGKGHAEPMNQQLPEQLAARLRQELPGPRIAKRVGSELDLALRYGPPSPGVRQAAVLVLLYPHEDQWHLPLTRRPEHLANHAGQISLPGGQIDPGETAAEAALREFHEELGTPGHDIDLLGQLSSLNVAASNFRIAPIVGTCGHRPAMTPSPAEVAELLEPPLAAVVDPGVAGHHLRRSAQESYAAPHIDWGTHRIWGATCLILSELAIVLEGMEI